MPGDFDGLEVPGRGPPGAGDATARVLGQRCAGSESCSGVCSGSVAGRYSRGPETDAGPSVTKPAVRSAESPFLVEVQEYRPRRIAVERLSQGLLSQDTCES